MGTKCSDLPDFTGTKPFFCLCAFVLPLIKNKWNKDLAHHLLFLQTCSLMVLELMSQHNHLLEEAMNFHKCLL